MRRLTQLYLELDRTTRTSDKVAALRSYFREASPEDSVWAVHVLSGRPIGRSVSSTRLSQWASEVSGIAPWLLGECYHVVGDFSETLSLILPENQNHEDPPSLHVVIEQRLRPLGKMRDADQRATI